MEEPAAIPLEPADRAILDIECATIAGHTCKVVRLARGAPGIAPIRARIEERIALVPKLSRRLGCDRGQPAWVPGGALDIERRVVPLDGGATLAAAEIPAAVARVFERRLDRDQPLWRIDVAPLDDGGAVLIWRIHHALADGTAAMRFARRLLWDELDPATAIHEHGRADGDEGRRHGHLAAMLEREFAESAHRSPFDGAIGTRRRISFATAAVAPLHDAARGRAGATLNDAILSVLAGSLRRWLEQHHGSLHGVRVRVPVSLHHEGDAAANLDSFFSLRLPLTVADPVERLRAVQRETERRKAAHDAEELREFLDELGAASARMRALAERIEASPRSFALSVSNVPGPREPVTMLGTPVESIHSIAEIGERHALRVAVVSLGGGLHFGFCADPGIVEGVEALAAGVETEVDALLGSDAGG